MTYRPKWDRVEHMNAGRDRALERRNNGGAGGGKVVARTTGGPEAGSLERFAIESRARWEGALTDFLEGLRFDLIGDQWEGL